MNIFPEKFIEFFSLPSTGTEVSIEIPADAAEMVYLRRDEIRGGVVSIIDITGVNDPTPSPTPETVTQVGRMAQAETSSNPTLQTQPVSADYTKQNKSPEIALQNDKDSRLAAAKSLVDSTAQTSAEAAAHFANILQDS